MITYNITPLSYRLENRTTPGESYDRYNEKSLRTFDSSTIEVQTIDKKK